MVDLRLPSIKGATEREQLGEIKSYLHQLVEQLQWALNDVNKSDVQVVPMAQATPSVQYVIPHAVAAMSEMDAQAKFDEIKPLIIKSAEIVNAYYEEINKKLVSLYVAESDFGTFKQAMEQSIEQTSSNVTQAFTNIQNIETEISYTQQDIEGINRNIEAIDGSVAAVEESVGVIDSTLKTVEESVGTLDEGLKTVEENVTDLDNNVQNAVTNIGEIEVNLQDTKVGIGSNLETLSLEVGKLDGDLEEVKSGIDTNLKSLTDEVGQIGDELQSAKESIDTDIDGIKGAIETINYTLVEANAHIKSGLLYYDENEVPVYGLEIGQRNYIDGVEVFNKYARFTAGRLSFYDQNDTEVAYISDRKLYITHVEIKGTLTMGGYIVNTSNGIAFKRVGRG